MNSTLFQELGFKEKIKERERREKERQERGERRGEKGIVDAFRGSLNSGSTSKSGLSKEDEAELSNIMVGAAVF